jgi:hypothetical protein
MCKNSFNVNDFNGIRLSFSVFNLVVVIINNLIFIHFLISFGFNLVSKIKFYTNENIFFYKTFYNIKY